MTNGNGPPSGFTRFPDPQNPAECVDFVKDIIHHWNNRPGKTQGRHRAVQVYGENPLTGYMIKIEHCGPNGP